MKNFIGKNILYVILIATLLDASISVYFGSCEKNTTIIFERSNVLPDSTEIFKLRQDNKELSVENYKARNDLYYQRKRTDSLRIVVHELKGKYEDPSMIKKFRIKEVGGGFEKIYE